MKNKTSKNIKNIYIMKYIFLYFQVLKYENKLEKLLSIIT